MKDEKRPIPLPDEEMRVCGEPIDTWDMVNKYGTYEVQDTTDTDFAFPCIGPAGSGPACVDMANKQLEKKPEQ